ncbi:MAG: YeeE/YedE family protein [Gemmatimonadales bacterium]|nr:MAG: YeeE/YedE family protein [Gemmatimonadales bacterium]
MEMLSQTWPWYVAGPLIGLVVPLLLVVGGKVFGVSANLRHMCAALPAPDRLKPAFLRYDWKGSGLWNLVFVLGVAVGGFLAVTLLGTPDVGASISEATRTDLLALGLTDLSGMVPSEIFSWGALASPAALLMVVGGGFLVGFGARYAGGCTSGHAISGLADLQLPSLVAVLGFFAGGLLVTFVLLPLILG